MMKRTIALAASVLLALVVTTTQVYAGWEDEPLKWQRSNTTEGLYFQSLITTGAAAKVDTTAAFRVDDADYPPVPLGSLATASDTTVLCKLVIYADSSVASSIDFGSTAVAIQANAGTNASGWQTWRTVSTLNTAGQKYIEVPIWTAVATITRDLYIDRNGNFSVFGNNLRAIVTQTGAGAIPTMKAKLVYYRR